MTTERSSSDIDATKVDSSSCIDCGLSEAGVFHPYYRRQLRRRLRCVLFGCAWEPLTPEHPEWHADYRRCRRCPRIQHLGHAAWRE